jgi:ATP/maltotriose-dependent transcriptional regulator MalT
MQAVQVLDGDEADELAANAWRLWMSEPRDIAGGRRFLEGRSSPVALYGAGLLALRAGDVAESRRLNEEALERADNAESTALAHLGLSRVAGEQGDAEKALQHALAAREASAALGEAIGPTPLHIHAQALRMQGDLDGAAELFEQSLAFNARIGDDGMVGVEYYNLGFVNLRRGDAKAAVRYLCEIRGDPLAAAGLAYARNDRDAAKAFLDEVDDDLLPKEDRAEAEWLRSRV